MSRKYVRGMKEERDFEQTNRLKVVRAPAKPQEARDLVATYMLVGCFLCTWIGHVLKSGFEPLNTFNTCFHFSRLLKRKKICCSCFVFFFSSSLHTFLLSFHLPPSQRPPAPHSPIHPYTLSSRLYHNAIFQINTPIPPRVPSSCLCLFACFVPIGSMSP